MIAHGEQVREFRFEPPAGSHSQSLECFSGQTPTERERERGGGREGESEKERERESARERERERKRERGGERESAHAQVDMPRLRLTACGFCSIFVLDDCTIQPLLPVSAPSIIPCVRCCVVVRTILVARVVGGVARRRPLRQCAENIIRGVIGRAPSSHAPNIPN